MHARKEGLEASLPMSPCGIADYASGQLLSVAEMVPPTSWIGVAIWQTWEPFTASSAHEE